MRALRTMKPVSIYYGLLQPNQKRAHKTGVWAILVGIAVLLTLSLILPFDIGAGLGAVAVIGICGAGPFAIHHALIRESDVRSMVRAVIRRRVNRHLDGTPQRGSFSEELRTELRRDQDIPSSASQEFLLPQHIDWIEKAYQERLRLETKRRTKERQRLQEISSDPSGVRASLDSIGGADYRPLREVKSFLDSFDELAAAERTSRASASRRQLDDFEAQMTTLSTGR